MNHIELLQQIKKKFINDFFFANVVVGLVNEIWPGEVQRNGTRVDKPTNHFMTSQVLHGQGDTAAYDF